MHMWRVWRNHLAGCPRVHSWVTSPSSFPSLLPLTPPPPSLHSSFFHHPTSYHPPPLTECQVTIHTDKCEDRLDKMCSDHNSEVSEGVWEWGVRVGGRERGGGEVGTKRGCEVGVVREWGCGYAGGEVECDKMFFFHAGCCVHVHNCILMSRVWLVCCQLYTKYGSLLTTCLDWQPFCWHATPCYHDNTIVTISNTYAIVLKQTMTILLPHAIAYLYIVKCIC